MNCFFNCKCVGISVIVSIILGIIAGILRATAVITVTSAFLWSVFGIAIGYLSILLISSETSIVQEIRACVRAIIPTVLTGVLGTVLTSLILLGVAFSATSIVASVITGFLIAFFSLLLTSAACLIKCKVGIDTCE